MTCRELVDFLRGHQAGELPGEVAAEFDRHLTLCGPCREYLRRYEGVIVACREAFAELDRALPPEMPEDLVRAILTAARASRST